VIVRKAEERGADRFVGREKQCQRLDRLLYDLRSGRGGALGVSGEPGVGKTVLLEHLVAEASGMTVLSTSGLESEASLSFAALGDLARPLIPLMEELPGPQSVALKSALALEHGHGPVGQYAVCMATLTLLTTSAEERPVLVTLDDAHWLDPASMSTLLFAARRLANDPVAVVFAVRDGAGPEFDARGIEFIRLRGLDRDATEQLLVSSRDGPVSTEVIDELWRATGGNPLALKEACVRLDDDQFAGRRRLDDPLPVGAELVRAFSVRLEPLPASARMAMLVIAISASSEADGLIAALAELGLDASVLDPADAAGLVAFDGSHLRFTHPLIRSAVQGGATSWARRRAYTALADTATGEARVWYRAAAEPGEHDQIAQELETVAGQLRHRSGLVSASRALRRAANLTIDHEKRATRLLAAAIDAQVAGRSGDATSWLAQARNLTGDPLLAADVDLARGRVLTMQGTPSIAQQVLIAAADAVAAADPRRAARLLCETVLPAIMEGRVHEAVAFGRKAMTLAEATGDRAEVVKVRMVLAQALVVSGHLVEANDAMADTRDSVERLDPVADGMVVSMTAACYGWLEDYSSSRRLLDRVIDAARAAGALGPLAVALSFRSELSRWTGAWVQAYADGEESLRLAREIRQLATVGYAQAILAHLDAAQGHAQLLRQRLAEARTMSGPLGSGGLMIWEGGARGLLHLAHGTPDEAIVCLEPAGAFAIRHGIGNPNVMPWEADLVEAYWRVGRVEDAADQLAEFEARARTTDLPTPRAAAERCRGLLATRTRDAETHFREAMALHEQRTQPFEQARTALSFGEMLRRNRRRSDSRPFLREALDTFEKLGAEPFARRAAAELAATGEHRPVRSGPSPIKQLTAQELQAALAVGRGLSNPAVAAAMFISRKTVEAHLSSVYRKLGVDSRTQLVRYLAEAGISVD
jgi:DNA-binding CsgD family transcriptional regulator